MVDQAFSTSFIRTLTDDVVHALERVERDETPTHRREAIRTIFAAIEGIVWDYREHVRTAARDLGCLTPLADFALQEKSYIVGERGDLVEQTRFVPLTTMIRLVTKVAEQTCPGYAIDFGHVGWSKLKSAIEIRNRLTHPKSEHDLEIGSKDLEMATSAFLWLLAAVEGGMSATNNELETYSREAKILLDELSRGDEATLKAFRRAFQSLEA